jgi:tetratricopeptide (TPR) repeat protein
MARGAAAGFWSLGRARARTSRHGLGRRSWIAAGLVLIGSMLAGACRAEPVKGEATLSAAGGYARLVLKFAEDVETEVTTAGSILVVRFKRPVDIPVEKLADAVPDYVGSARRDPDGSAIRLSLARSVKVNTMMAGERVFVDLLPDTWSGLPPGLPSEVVRELAERARAAERLLRQQRVIAEASKRAPIRVRASLQPTFVRFIFETPAGVGVSSVLNEQKLTLSFNAVLTFDLADARVSAPANVASISQKIDGDQSAVEIALIGDVDIHSFRDEKNYVVDVAFQQSEKSSASSSPASDNSQVPASAAPAVPAASERPADDPPARKSGEVAPMPPERFARAADVEVKPEPAPKLSPEPAMPDPAHPAKETPDSPAQLPSKITLAAAEPPSESGASESAAADPPKRNSDGLTLTFSFDAPTPAALFRHADTAWLVFDSVKPVDIDAIRGKGGTIVAEVDRLPLDKGQAIRIRLKRPQMVSLTGDDPGRAANWTVTFADTMQTPTQPLMTTRNIADPALANVTVPLSRPGLLHRFVDPDAGDTLVVVTAPPPIRGFIRRQDFVEMSLLESIHGVAIHPGSDDVTTEVASDRIVIGRPGGLTLSSASIGTERATTAVQPIFDLGMWRKNQAENFIARENALITTAAAAEPEQRGAARIDLARFYLSRGMYPEAKGVLDLALMAAKQGVEDPVALILHSVASILMGRPEEGLKDLVHPAIGSNYDSQLWKALAYARQGKWVDAREKFKNAEFTIASLPIELQRIAIAEAMRASLEVKDYSGAAKRGGDLEVVGLPSDLKPAVAVLRGRLAEALGHDRDALNQYIFAVQSSDRAAAAEGKLLEMLLRNKRAEISQADALRELEGLSMTWRGDGLEVKAQQMMARVYSDTGRYGESLAAARTATRLQPNSEASRQGQDEAAALFAQLFLGTKGDDLPPVDALGVFYEYRELTPIGRRGDEMIRRLADRLVAVDLLDQASELLQYQVDRRLEGAARAQVAARLAMVYLTNRKPDRAIAALRTTRIADLSGELRQQRLLLEARAQSDVGRRDLALDIIANFPGREAIRLRSDIYWASRRWREASEQIELYYADRWQDFKPLNSVEKGDVIRAAVGYALAEDSVGLARFREKYAPLMNGEPDRATFEAASKPTAAGGAEFTQIAKIAASVDTLDGFLREMKTRFPDATAKAPLPPETPKADPFPTGALPDIVGLKRVEVAN